MGRQDVGSVAMSGQGTPMLRIRWHDPESPGEAFAEADYANDNPEGARGTVMCEYWDPATLAMELHIIASKQCVDDFRMLDGSLIYMMGQPSLFWSAVLHFRAHGTCCPTLAKKATWGDTAFWSEMRALMDRLPARGDFRARPPPDLGSRNMAIVAFLQNKTSADKVIPWCGYHENDALPTAQDDAPDWWRLAAEPWDRALSEMFKRGEKLGPAELPCQFFATIAATGGVGCACPGGLDYSSAPSGVSACPFRHDDWWLAMCRDRRAHPRVCFGCGRYASTSCTACDSVFICRDCPATIGMERCNSCTSADRPSVRAVAAPATARDESRARYAPVAGGRTNIDDVNETLGTRVAVGGLDTCGHCASTEGPFKKCGRCRNTVYCSVDCQKKAWPAHKRHCEALRDRRKEVRAAGDEPGVKMVSDASGVGFVGVLIASPPVMSHAHFSNLAGATEAMVHFSKLDECEPWIRFLLACGPCDDIEAAKGALDVLCERTADPAARAPGVGFTALEWAARKGNFEVAEWLATDPRSRRLVKVGAPVGWALYTNRVKLARMLVAKGADATATDAVLFGCRPPLLVAAGNGQLLALQFLVEELGFDIHETDRLGRGILETIASETAGGNADVAASIRAWMQGQPAAGAELDPHPDGSLNLTPAQAACATWARNRGATR